MSEVVEYDQLVSFLKSASLFEIYRVANAIRNELENPIRISSAKTKFKEGDYIEYFDEKSNVLIRARVLKKQQKKVLVQNSCDLKQWLIPYHCIKVDSREFDFRNSDQKGLHKNELSVGQWVGFNNKAGEVVVGRIQGLNQKTVSLITALGHRWRVAYQLLYTIIDGQKNENVVVKNIESIEVK